jgi:hypothetical protein
VLGGQLWVFGGDAPSCGMLPPHAHSLELRLGRGGACTWRCPTTTGPPPPSCCDAAAVACGSHLIKGASGSGPSGLVEYGYVLLLGGSSAGGYLPMGELPILDTHALTWSRLKCQGVPPAARAGHVAAAVRGADGAHRVLVYGGGK